MIHASSLSIHRIIHTTANVPHEIIYRNTSNRSVISHSDAYVLSTLPSSLTDIGVQCRSNNHFLFPSFPGLALFQFSIFLSFPLFCISDTIAREESRKRKGEDSNTRGLRFRGKPRGLGSEADSERAATCNRTRLCSEYADFAITHQL